MNILKKFFKEIVEKCQYSQNKFIKFTKINNIFIKYRKINKFSRDFFRKYVKNTLN